MKKIIIFSLTTLLLGGVVFFGSSPGLNLGSSVLNTEASCDSIDTEISTGVTHRESINTQLTQIQADIVSLSQEKTSLLSQTSTSDDYALQQQKKLETFQKDFFSQTQFQNEFYLQEALNKLTEALTPTKIRQLRNEIGVGYFGSRKFRKTIILFKTSLDKFQALQTEYQKGFAEEKQKIFSEIEQKTGNKNSIDEQIANVTLQLSNKVIQKNTFTELQNSLTTEMQTLQTKKQTCTTVNNVPPATVNTTTPPSNIVAEESMPQGATTDIVSVAHTNTNKTDSNDSDINTAISTTTTASATPTNNTNANTPNPSAGTPDTTVVSTENAAVNIAQDTNSGTDTTQSSTVISQGTTASSGTTNSNITTVQTNPVSATTVGGLPLIPPYVDPNFLHPMPSFKSVPFTTFTGGKICWFSTKPTIYGNWFYLKNLDPIIRDMTHQTTGFMYLDQIYLYPNVKPTTPLQDTRWNFTYMGPAPGSNGFWWTDRYGITKVVAVNVTETTGDTQSFFAIRTLLPGYRSFIFDSNFDMQYTFYGCFGPNDPLPKW